MKVVAVTALLVVVALVSATTVINIQQHVGLTQDLVDHVNSVQSSWRAGHNSYFEGKDESFVRGLCGVREGGIQLPESDLEVLITHSFILLTCK